MRDKEADSIINSKNLDIRVKKDGTWIDQKCTPDIVSYVADCILNYVMDKEDAGETDISFTIKEIMLQPYSNEHIGHFGKPEVEAGSREYDKVFSQPIKMFNYADILSIKGHKKRAMCFTVKNRDFLEYLASGDNNSLHFLYIFIKKTLSDSGIKKSFDEFFLKQDKKSYSDVKTDFANLMKNNTPRGGSRGGDLRDVNRVFTKVVNTIAFVDHKKGTIRGALSKDVIQKQDIEYNRRNFYDELTSKPKATKRNEHEVKINEDLDKQVQYDVAKAKNRVRSYNRKYNNGKSECFLQIAEIIRNIDKDNESQEIEKKATQMHHIFMQSDFPDIAATLENIIALSPNQHFLNAHPDGNTHIINRLYQYYLLLCKYQRIQNDEYDKYSLESFINVLNVGFNTTDFTAFLDNSSGLEERIAKEYLDNM